MAAFFRFWAAKTAVALAAAPDDADPEEVVPVGDSVAEPASLPEPEPELEEEDVEPEVEPEELGLGVVATVGAGAAFTEGALTGWVLTGAGSGFGAAVRPATGRNIAAIAIEITPRVALGATLCRFP